MFNLLPLLPLDGGHMAVAIADGVRNTRAKAKGLAKPAPFDVERLTPITMVGLCFDGFFITSAAHRRYPQPSSS